MSSQESWDKSFMTMAYLVAMRSKDQSTHIGAVIIGPDKEVVTTGYNSFVRGLNDNLPERQERPEKYYWFEHAERNAIYNAVRHGSKLKGCSIYTQGLPCTDCMRGIIQSGIKEVIIHQAWTDAQDSEKWIESARRSREMASETGVVIRIYDGGIDKELDSLVQGKEVI